MLIQHKQDEKRGIFFVQEEGEILAELAYSMAGDDRMIIEHTEVDEQLRGKNVGYELVHAAVEYARERHLKITPVCTFTAAVFDKKPDFADVLF
jgi:uncharacterized protein